MCCFRPRLQYVFNEKLRIKLYTCKGFKWIPYVLCSYVPQGNLNRLWIWILLCILHSFSRYVPNALLSLSRNNQHWKSIIQETSLHINMFIKFTARSLQSSAFLYRMEALSLNGFQALDWNVLQEESANNQLPFACSDDFIRVCRRYRRDVDNCVQLAFSFVSWVRPRNRKVEIGVLVCVKENAVKGKKWYGGSGGDIVWERLREEKSKCTENLSIFWEYHFCTCRAEKDWKKDWSRVLKFRNYVQRSHHNIIVTPFVNHDRDASISAEFHFAIRLTIAIGRL